VGQFPAFGGHPAAGKAGHIYLLMAGSSSAMQSRIDNGEVVVTYTDGSATRLALENPTTCGQSTRIIFIDDFWFPPAEPFRRA